MTTSWDDDAAEPGDAEVHAGYVPTIGDVVTRWRYTLTPTCYTDENSDTTDLLWQQTLETRAVRAWLVVLTVLVPLCTVAVIVTLLLVLGDRQ